MGQKKQINARVPDNLHGLIVERANLIEGNYSGDYFHLGSPEFSTTHAHG